YLEPFRLSPKKLQEVSDGLQNDMIRGVGKDTHQKVSVKMLPTFIRETPDRTEKGDFLALDLGGTNLRVFRVRLTEEEQKKPKLDSEQWPISKEIKEGTGEQSILLCWSKDFNCSGVEGEDVVKLLKEAIHRRGEREPTPATWRR
ncbi:hypothetical protein XENOCAPTIV_012439, partial [Xenoophorus captivus]